MTTINEIILDRILEKTFQSKEEQDSMRTFAHAFLSCGISDNEQQAKKFFRALKEEQNLYGLFVKFANWINGEHTSDNKVD